MKDSVDPGTLTVLVTGATSGFGRAIATGRRADRLDALRAELGEACQAFGPFAFKPVV